MKYKYGYVGLITYRLLDNPLKSCLLLFFVLIACCMVVAKTEPKVEAGTDADAGMKIVADLLYSLNKDVELLEVFKPTDDEYRGDKWKVYPRIQAERYLRDRLGSDYINAVVIYRIGTSVKEINLLEITGHALTNEAIKQRDRESLQEQTRRENDTREIKRLKEKYGTK